MSRHGGLFEDGSIDWPRLLLLALVGSLLIVLGTTVATSSTGFGPYNPSWDGSTEFRQDVESDPATESHLIRDTARYEELPANETVAFVVAPDASYEGVDAERVREFVENGGTVVVLENFGDPGNRLLADVGAEARFDGRLLRDDRHHLRGPAMPIATNVENHTLTNGVDRLTLNYATAVEPGNATVLVASSDFTSLGSEADDEDRRNELRSHPVATVESVGEGRVVAVGDPSITVNAMYDESDNAAFVRGLYADADHVVFDRSHGTNVPPLIGTVLAIRNSQLLQLLVGSLGIGLVATLSRVRARSALEVARARLLPSVRSNGNRDDQPPAPELSDAERAEYLRRRHPDWDEEQIQHVITALNHPRSEGDTDQ